MEFHSDSPRQKVCFRCSRFLDIDQFYRHPGMTDGHLGKCKECTKSDSCRRYREKHAQVVAYDKRRGQDPSRKAKKILYQKAHRALHPDRYLARNKVWNALRDGKLVRQNCRSCGSPKSEAHHEDYSRPLDVMWLCRRCHRLHEGRLVTLEANV